MELAFRAAQPGIADMSYLRRRLIHGILLLIGASVLCFLFTDLAPGSFFDEIRLNPQISPATVAALRSHYGLDQSTPVRYGRWVKSVFQGRVGLFLCLQLSGQRPAHGAGAQYSAADRVGHFPGMADCRAFGDLDG